MVSHSSSLTPRDRGRGGGGEGLEKYTRIVIKQPDSKIAAGTRSHAVEAAVLELCAVAALELHEVLADVEHLSEAGEEEDLLAAPETELVDQLVKQDEL